MYDLERTDECSEQIRKLTNKDFELKKALEGKIEQIRQYPYHFKPLSNILHGKRRVHLGCVVLIYEIDENRKTVILRKFGHHDEIYK